MCYSLHLEGPTNLVCSQLELSGGDQITGVWASSMDQSTDELTADLQLGDGIWVDKAGHWGLTQKGLLFPAPVFTFPLTVSQLLLLCQACYCVVLDWTHPTIDWNLYKLCQNKTFLFNLWASSIVSQQQKITALEYSIYRVQRQADLCIQLGHRYDEEQETD